ncbi:hypothetical protein EZ449_15510 [Pedobacter frigidisoli]|uniref:Uncharacterized protein n=1 Tax=Pedobacter frigidisoli TaxID=2530455 RepID=A0A4R0NYY4_9SPHI|nr:hypothetical protein [Pedobacter frigidisoli]TCD05868.1 hypothetical protein EZ449_15510 [Pedobacter frigidisoli]
MGGREGFKGYILQALVCILSGLRNDDWAYIALEPDDELQKVDIQWSKEDDLTVCQVKSTVNDFQKGPVLSILQDLVREVPGASKFTVLLLGNSSSATRKYFSELCEENEENLGKIFPTSIHLGGKLEVKFNPISIDDTLALICNELHRYLSEKGYRVNHETINLIALGLMAQFSRFATNGTKVSRMDFESGIIKWAAYNYPEAMTNDMAGLELLFYNPDTMEASSENCTVYRLTDITEEEIYTNKLIKLRELYFDIDRIKLAPRASTKEQIEDKQNPLRIMPLTDFKSMFGDKSYAGCSENEISQTTAKCKSIVGCDLPVDFFNVGNLEESRDYRLAFPFGGNRAFFGSVEQESKQKMIEEFIWLLDECEDLLDVWGSLQEYLLIPLIISNQSNKLHQDIDLQLQMDVNTELLNGKNFPYPNDIDNIEYFSCEENVLEQSLQLQKDKCIDGYDYRSMLPMKMNFNLPFTRTKESELGYLNSVVERIFDYEEVPGMQGKTTVECKFKALKPKGKMALPSYLLVKSNAPFSIEYELRSNQGAGFTGKLLVKE